MSSFTENTFSSTSKTNNRPNVNTSTSALSNPRKSIDVVEELKWLTIIDEILSNHFQFKDTQFADEIIDGQIWLGDSSDAKNIEAIQKRNITNIINCASTEISVVYPSKELFNVLKIDATDNSRYNLLDIHLQKCLNFFDVSLKQKKGRLLIHCMAGMNRSVTILIAYMITVNEDMDLLKAIQFVCKRRAWILTNEGFKRQLIRYAHKIGKLKPKNKEIMCDLNGKLLNPKL